MFLHMLKHADLVLTPNDADEEGEGLQRRAIAQMKADDLFFLWLLSRLLQPSVNLLN